MSVIEVAPTMFEDDLKMEKFKDSIILQDIDDNNEDFIVIEENNLNNSQFIVEDNSKKIEVTKTDYSSMTVSNLRNIIFQKDFYSKIFRRKNTKTHNKCTKNILIDFLNYMETEEGKGEIKIEIQKKRDEELKVQIEKNINPAFNIPKEDIIVKENPILIESIDKSNDYYKHAIDDLDKLKNPKKLSDSLKPLPKKEEEDYIEQELTEEEKEKKRLEEEEMRDINYKIDLYLERFTWLKTQNLTYTRLNPKELLSEIEMKVSSRNLTGLVTSSFFSFCYSAENYVEENYREYIKMRGFTYNLECSEQFKECLAELQIKYASSITAIMCPEARLALILAQTLYNVHQHNDQKDQREELSKKKIIKEDLKSYDDL